MNFIHTDFQGSEGDVAIVTLDAQANVMLLDESNFSAYQNAGTFNYFGGWATKSPVRLVAPRSGHWHIVIDMGGGAGQVRASIQVVQRTLR
jgi:hypothetical protein